MSKNLTKYQYRVDFPNCGSFILDYKLLASLGLKSSITAFWRNKSDIVFVKGCRVERKRVVS